MKAHGLPRAARVQPVGRTCSEATRQCARPSTGRSTGRAYVSPGGPYLQALHGPTSSRRASQARLRGRDLAVSAFARTCAKARALAAGHFRTGGSWSTTASRGVEAGAGPDRAAETVNSASGLTTSDGAASRAARHATPTWDIRGNDVGYRLSGVCSDNGRDPARILRSRDRALPAGQREIAALVIAEAEAASKSGVRRLEALWASSTSRSRGSSRRSQSCTRTTTATSSPTASTRSSLEYHRSTSDWSIPALALK